ncbi:hypothetical protein NQ315_007896 [Exocentrus adspersus]|uniref:Uncharacterized protein n=1 Tax=Exocentrus adspersus TaxID=1586481 RepID=A0AAV8W8E4_9CUCU|nr:hypothetical protein NQ315_007896 [Exocentrus adspersus]
MSLLLLPLWVSFTSAVAQDVSFVEDIRALSELPLDKLLHIKNTFKVAESKDVYGFDTNTTTTEIPQALALQAKKSSKDREIYHYDDSSSSYKDKSSGIQSIFQISVTTLAFLAFGGYLICLLVQAVKGKTNDPQSTATQIMSALISNANIKRRRPTRTPYNRLQQKPSNGYRRKRRPRPKKGGFS